MKKVNYWAHAWRFLCTTFSLFSYLYIEECEFKCKVELLLFCINYLNHSFLIHYFLLKHYADYVIGCIIIAFLYIMYHDTFLIHYIMIKLWYMMYHDIFAICDVSWYLFDIFIMIHCWYMMYHNTFLIQYIRIPFSCRDILWYFFVHYIVILF